MRTEFHVPNLSTCECVKNRFKRRDWLETCDIRPEWPKCNLCRIRNFGSRPSGLVVFKSWERCWNVWPDGEGWNILVF